MSGPNHHNGTEDEGGATLRMRYPGGGPPGMRPPGAGYIPSSFASPGAPMGGRGPPAASGGAPAGGDADGGGGGGNGTPEAMPSFFNNPTTQHPPQFRPRSKFLL